jgi:serine/threonine-protein kinase
VPLDSGQQVGRFKVVRLLAQGGMAEVYRAEQELTAGFFRPAALKVIRPEYSQSPDFREMFLDEARVAATLSHPNIVHIYEVGEADGLLYMAMELVPGETLATVNRALREHDTRLTDEALFAVGIAACSALEAVHALKVEGGLVNLVHRDVSPHNLLLSSSGTLKLIDFGIAKAATNRNLTNPGVTKGKAGYFSPEQAMGKKLDGRSDLFSVAVTLYKLACGSTPFDDYKTHAERNGALVRGRWQPLEQVFTGLAPGFYEVLNRAMQLKPEDRYANAREMRDALERVAYEANIRVGPSTLLDYVNDDGEVTRSGAASVVAQARFTPEPTRSAPKATASIRLPTPAPPKPVAPPGPPRNTERVAAAPAPSRKDRSRILALVGAFAAAVALGVTGTVLIISRGSGDVEVEATEPVVRQAARPDAPTLAVAQPVGAQPSGAQPSGAQPSGAQPSGAQPSGAQPSGAQPSGAQPSGAQPSGAQPSGAEPSDVGPAGPPPSGALATAQPEAPDKAGATATRPSRPPVVVNLPEPTSAPKPVRPRPAPVTAAVVQEKPPAVEAPIAAGEGRIRIGIKPQSAVTRVLVGKEDWGAAPLDRKVPSGHYTLVVRLADGKRSAPMRADVQPDQTTKLVYDVDAEKWDRSP